MGSDPHKPSYITVEEMRQRLSLSRTKAYELASSGAFETITLGRSLRIEEGSLNQWLKGQKSS
jgi:excisionase family DNA binding protein